MTKVLTILIIVLCSSNISIGQNQSKFHHILKQSDIDKYGFVLQRKYSTKDTVLLQKVINNDTIRSINIVDVSNKQIMTISEPLKCVISLDKTTPTLDIWQITKNPAIVNDNTINASTNLNASTFVLIENRKTIGDPTRPIVIPFYAWTWSIGTTPIRYRFKTDSSSASVSSSLGLSISYGYTFGKTTFTSRSAVHKSITIAPFLGIATAELKKETVKTPKIWDANKTYTQTNLALSYGISGTVARNNLGLVFSLGFDQALGDRAQEWSYQNKLWLGVGINVSLGILK
jgi:hypothetical protein